VLTSSAGAAAAGAELEAPAVPAAAAAAGLATAFCTNTTRKPVSSTLYSDTAFESSSNTLPLYTSFSCSFGKASPCEDSTELLSSPTVVFGSASTLNVEPLMVLNVSFMVAGPADSD
jgi:hypothetical protein